MKCHRLMWILAGVLISGLSCGGGDDDWDDRDHWDDVRGRSTITGTAAFRERIALPPDAQLHVELCRVAPNGRPIEVVATRRVFARGMPIRYAIPFDGDRIEPGAFYAVRGELRGNGRVMFHTVDSFPVISRGHSNRADLMLVSTGGGGGRPDQGHGHGHGQDHSTGPDLNLRGRIDGEAIFRERIRLPRDARMRVELVEVNGNRPGRVIAHEDVAARGSPIPYRLRYDKDRIDARKHYAVRARVMIDGRARFASAELYPVVTRGRPEFANIYLVAHR